jgi:hypothetical protein
VKALTSIEFLHWDTKVNETKPILAHEVTAADRRAVICQMEISLPSEAGLLHLPNKRDR